MWKILVALVMIPVIGCVDGAEPLSGAELALGGDQLELGAERGVVDPSHGPAYGDQSGPALASDGGRLLAVWRDRQSSIIAGAFVAPDGTPIDRVPFRIAASSTPPATSDPAVAWNGEHFVVVFASSSSLDVVRVAADGAILDETARALATTHDSTPRVASDGDSALAVWVEAGELRSARITRAGAIEPGSAFGGGAAGPSDPTITSTGAGYFVAWTAGGPAGDVHGIALTAAGVPLDPAAIAMVVKAGNQGQPALAHRNGELLLAWKDDVWDAGATITTAIVAQRFTSDGAPIDAAARLVAAGSIVPDVTRDRASQPTATVSGSTYLVAWRSCRWRQNATIPGNYFVETCWYEGVRLDLQAAPLGAAPLAITSPSSSSRDPLARHAVEAAAGGYVALVRETAPPSDPAGASHDVVAYAIPEVGAPVGAPAVLSQGAGNQLAPAVAWGGGAYLVAWQDGRDRGIYVRRVAADGTPLGAGSVAVTPFGPPPTPTSYAQLGDRPAVTFDGTRFWVFWDRHFVRLGPDGTVLDPIPRNVSDYPMMTPRAVSDGDRVLVVWTDFVDTVGFFDEYHLRGQFLDLAGNPVGPRHTFESTITGRTPPLSYDVGVVGSSFLVSVTRGAGVNRLTVFHPGGTWEGFLLQTDELFLASDGTDHVAVGHVRHLRIGSTGTVLDARPRSSDPGPVATGGAHLLLARVSGSQGQLDARRIAFDGAPLEPSAHLLALGVQGRAALASSGDGRWLVAYQRYRSEPGYGAHQVSYRILDGHGEALAADTVAPSLACPPAAVVTAPDEQGVAVDYPPPTATDDVDPAPVRSCDHPSGAGFAIGTTSVRCTATDWSGNIGSCAFDITVAVPADVAPPALTVPATITTIASAWGGEPVVYQASAVDGHDGVVAPSCTPAAGATLPLGVTTVSCSATDAAGNTATASFMVRVELAWSGLLPPIDPGGTSSFKREGPIKVRFQLTGASSGIADAVATLTLRRLSSQGLPIGPVVTPTWHGSNVFRYRSAKRRYVFKLATTGLAAGGWQLNLALGDGVARSATITLRN